MKIEKMEIEIQKDLNKFKEELLFGMTFRQLKFVIIGVIVAIGLYAILTLLGVPYIKEVLIVIIVIPIFINGFFVYQNLTLVEFLQNILNFIKNKNVIFYKDYEIDELLEMGDNDDK